VRLQEVCKIHNLYTQ